jgi:hypothetical protein
MVSEAMQQYGGDKKNISQIEWGTGRTNLIHNSAMSTEQWETSCLVNDAFGMTSWPFQDVSCFSPSCVSALPFAFVFTPVLQWWAFHPTPEERHSMHLVWPLYTHGLAFIYPILMYMYYIPNTNVLYTVDSGPE